MTAKRDEEGVFQLRCVECHRFIGEVEVIRGLDVKLYFSLQCPNRRCKLHKAKEDLEFEIEFDDIFFVEEENKKKK